MADTLIPADEVEEAEAPAAAADPFADEVPIDPHHYTSTGVSHTKLLMWIFLASECLLFGALISTYMLYRGRIEPTDVGPTDVFDIPFTSVSSFVLLMSSLTMVLAVANIARGDIRRFRAWTVTTAMLGAVFVGGQVYEFTVFREEGLGFTTNVFGSAFYTLTGFHGAHVTFGIIMLMTLLVFSLSGRIQRENAEAVETVGLYWHFVDIVWIVIFTVVYLFPQPGG